jgi:hypothetical protein
MAESPQTRSQSPDPTAVDGSAPSYVDLPALLSPTFSATAHANALILSTNNPDDPPPLDLSTPLSRVLFDSQEIDSRIDTLATRHAIELLTHTQKKAKAADNIVDTLDAHIKSLNDNYAQLEKEVITRHAEADEVRNVVTRTWEALRLAKSVGRCLNLGRQLEVQASELSGREKQQQPRKSQDQGQGQDQDKGKGKDEDDNHRALVRCAHTILSLREVLDKISPGQEGHGLTKVDAIQVLSEGIVAPIERSVRDTSKRIIREFSVSAAATFAQGEDTRSRTVSALVALYLLTPTANVRPDKWTPGLLVQALEEYVRTAVQSSVAGMARGLGQLPTLERALGEVVGRCQNVVALEMVLEATRPPGHPLLTPPVLPPQPQATPDGAAESATERAHVYTPPPNLLQPLLSHLETGSLASFFWRTMAGSVSTRVQEMMSRGGVAARTLKTNKTAVGDAIREAVAAGSAVPSSLAGLSKRGKAKEEKRWDMETAVMVGSVVNNLGR